MTESDELELAKQMERLEKENEEVDGDDDNPEDEDQMGPEEIIWDFQPRQDKTNRLWILDFLTVHSTEKHRDFRKALLKLIDFIFCISYRVTNCSINSRISIF